jgi:FKBP-type peptidyl-prolyl cis-trans isomerase SlyD
MTAISDNTVVYFHYTLTNESGDTVETSLDGEPSAYLHGADNILPGLEQALAGKAAGDKVEVTLPPEQAYGPRQPDRVQRVPVKHLIYKGKLRPGLTVQVNTADGRRPATVVKAGKFSADIDTNHPLAGQTLTFHIDVIELREASAEERAHRHVHGPGGHQH